MMPNDTFHVYWIKKLKMEPFFKKYRGIILGKCMPGTNGSCLIWTGAVSSNTYGAISYKLFGKWHRTTVHRLAFMLFNERIDIGRQLDVSHLCHNSLCVFKDHLTVEPHCINSSRIKCLNRNVCLGHWPYQECQLQLKMDNDDSIYRHNSFIHQQAYISLSIQQLVYLHTNFSWWGGHLFLQCSNQCFRVLFSLTIE